MIELTVLGFGGWLSNPFLHQSSYLINVDDIKVLLDAGEGTYFNLRKCTKLDIEDIDYLIISHAHGDHVLGIPTILQVAMFKGVKVKILSTEPTINSIKELTASVGAKEFLKSAEFTYLPMEGTSEIDEITITTVRAIHPIPAISLTLMLGNHKISYSGDTALNLRFLEASKESDLLIHELSAPKELSDEAREYGHTSAADLKTIIEIAHPKYLLPTHYYIYPPMIDLNDLKCVPTKLLTPAPCAYYKL